MISSEDWLVALATGLVIVLCVLVHFEGLRIISDRLPKPKWHPRRRMIFLILAMLALHVLEVWIFGVSYFFLIGYEGYGSLHGVENANLIDCIYFSATVFSTVGFGDIYPVGAIRIMTGTEAIAGLTLITWSASYTFVEMLKTWQDDD